MSDNKSLHSYYISAPTQSNAADLTTVDAITDINNAVLRHVCGQRALHGMELPFGTIAEHETAVSTIIDSE